MEAKETMNESRGDDLRASLRRSLDRLQTEGKDLRERARNSARPKERGELLQRAEELTAEVRAGEDALARAAGEATHGH